MALLAGLRLQRLIHLRQEDVLVFFGYDTLGNRTSISDAYGSKISLTYDGKGQILTLTDPLGNQAQMTYDTKGRLIKLVDPKKGVYELQYSGGDLVKVIDPKKGNIELHYTSKHLLKTLKDENDRATLYEYDALGNLLKATNPVGGIDSYTYDEVGRIKTHTDPKGNVFTFERDDLGRITEIKLNGQNQKTLTYDCCSLNAITDEKGT